MNTPILKGRQPRPMTDLGVVKRRVPKWLQKQPIWLRWRSESNGSGLVKKPYYADGTPRRGTLDSPEDRANLVSFDDVCRAFDPKVDAGIGVALGRVGDIEISGIDLDDVRGEDGTWDPRVEKIRTACPEAYSEVSPSGTGIKIFGVGSIGTARPPHETGEPSFEIYSGKRFFTFTGDQLGKSGGAPVNLVRAASVARKLFCASGKRPELAKVRSTKKVRAVDESTIRSRRSKEQPLGPGNRHNPMLSYLLRLRMKGADDATLRRDGDAYARRHGGMDEKDFDELVDWVTKKVRAPPEGSKKAFHIELRSGQEDRVLAELQGILAGGVMSMAQMVVYGGTLCMTKEQRRRGFKQREVIAVEFFLLTPPALQSVINEYVDFTAWRRSRDGTEYSINVDCPSWLVVQLLARADLIGSLPFQCAGLSSVPILRDGKLLARHGFDEGSGLWLHSFPVDITILARPTKKDAELALAILNELVAEFEFTDERSRTAAISELMVGGLRASMRMCPVYLNTKRTYGEGGSYLASLAAAIQIGRDPPVLALQSGRNFAEELDKTITGAQLAGAEQLIVDNWREGEPFGGELLKSISTQSDRVARLLGTSEVRRVVNSQLVISNGVNVVINDDFLRRLVVVRLDTHNSRPETRVFKRPKLLEEVIADRGRILSAIFTIAAAFHLSGVEPMVSSFNGFGEWSQLIGKPLVWLGLHDVAGVPGELRAQDQKSELLMRLLPLMQALCTVAEKPNGIAVAQIIEPRRLCPELYTDLGALKLDPKTVAKGDKIRELCADIREVLGEATGAKTFDGRSQLNARAVGKFLSLVEGRSVDVSPSTRLSVQRGAMRVGYLLWKILHREVAGEDSSRGRRKTRSKR